MGGKCPSTNVFYLASKTHYWRKDRRKVRSDWKTRKRT